MDNFPSLERMRRSLLCASIFVTLSIRIVNGLIVSSISDTTFLFESCPVPFHCLLTDRNASMDAASFCCAWSNRRRMSECWSIACVEDNVRSKLPPLVRQYHCIATAFCHALLASVHDSPSRLMFSRITPGESADTISCNSEATISRSSPSCSKARFKILRVFWNQLSQSSTIVSSPYDFKSVYFCNRSLKSINTCMASLHWFRRSTNPVKKFASFFGSVSRIVATRLLSSVLSTLPIAALVTDFSRETTCSSWRPIAPLASCACMLSHSACCWRIVRSFCCNKVRFVVYASVAVANSSFVVLKASLVWL
mmetsp:Transcript_8023/g.14715  ORF Transcript_8023/g.14715 Transcript_8023/m.14715 type:complete len:310 (-) Transcript_8023:5109-6038(-)